MANIQLPSKQQDMLFGKIIQAGLIKQSKRIDNLNVQVLFQDTNSEVAVEITDFRNLGNQYLMLIGGPYYVCEHCGLTVKQNEHKQYRSRKQDCAHNGRGRKQRYCSACAAEIKTQQSVESVVRRRSLK